MSNFNPIYSLVSTFSSTFSEEGIIYFVPDVLREKIKLGQLVEVPFRKRQENGVVIKFLEKEDLKIDEEKIKNITKIKNEILLLKNWQLEIITWLSKYYFTAIHNSLNLAFPRGIRDKILKGKLVLDDGEVYKYKFDSKNNLSPEQDKAYNKIKNSKNNNVLVHGITGSGKTEIYIKLIKDNLDLGKQSLLLIPEIILGNQIGEKIKNIFGEEVVIINSSITESKKSRYWVDIFNNNAKIVVGTRSALFYPYKDLGIIIVDEEHDNSYVSDKNPRYKVREVVKKMVQVLNIKSVFGSGTPSIKIMYDSLKGEYELVSLLKKWR